MPDIEKKLKKGDCKVLDIGCGIGWSSISLAKGFPNIKNDAIEMDHESIKKAQEYARAEGVDDKIRFFVPAAE